VRAALPPFSPLPSTPVPAASSRLLILQFKHAHAALLPQANLGGAVSGIQNPACARLLGPGLGRDGNVS
jgi:hypothetical protein